MAASTAMPPSVVTRVRRGVRRQENWRQLVKFGLVGASGYVLNLAVFALAVEGVGVAPLVGAALAFVVAVANNFWWNRHWTFTARGGRIRLQAVRFFAVSIAAFAGGATTLQLLISVFGAAPVLAQAIAVGAMTPLNFIGNKMWSFALGARRIA